MKLSVFIRRVSTKTTMCMIQQTCDTHRTPVIRIHWTLKQGTCVPYSELKINNSTCIFIILDYLYVYIKKTEKMTSDDIK